MFPFGNIDPNDRIVKRGFGWVIDDLVNLFIITSDTFHECLFVIRDPDTVERYRIMRRIVRLQKRIHVSFFLYLLFTHTNFNIYMQK